MKKKGDLSEVKLQKRRKAKEKKEWKKPSLEDVSGKVMAQPYIRFT